MRKRKRMPLFFLISCMLFTLCGCGASDRQETVTESTDSGINADMGETDNSLGSNETSNDKTDSPESGSAGNDDVETESTGKVLIAYFSRADENYGVGYIEKGNTAIIAEMIAEETGGELFHIERETPYPAAYDECTEEAKQEQKDNARPALAEDKDIAEYDVIFLGYAGSIIGLN